MDRFMGKFFILVLLVASLSGATLLSPKQDAGSGPGVTPGAMSLERGAGMFGQNLPGPSELRQYTAGGHVLGFRPGGVIIATGSHALRIEFVNARPVSPVEEGIPADPAKGRGPAPALGKVTYHQLWDGVTVVYEKAESTVVKSTYYVQPGKVEAYKPAEHIRLRYNVPVKVDGSGGLLLSFATGEMRETRPVAWQTVSGIKVAVEAEYRLLGEREVGFAVGPCDSRYPLVIDPALSWNSFMGGSDIDYGCSIAVDTSGNSYVIGYSRATWGSPLLSFAEYWDAFVAKLDANGALQWNTFLGGSGYDFGYGIAVDTNGNSYVIGASDATWGSPIRPFTAGGSEAFAAKLNNNGALLWSTFLGGTGSEHGFGIAVDMSGNSYLTGESYTTWGSPIRAFAGIANAFAAKLDVNGSLQWNTFLGGSGSTSGNGITVDTSGNSFVAGTQAYGTWGSPIRAFAGIEDAFVAKLGVNGALLWNTFLGGSNYDFGYGIAMDISGNSYVTGYSNATWGSPISSFAGGKDAFVAKIDTNGAFQWNTFLGGSGDDYGMGLAVDSNGNIYVTGLGSSTWGSPYNPFAGGSNDALVAKLDTNGALQWNTFLGGSDNDGGNGIAVDTNGNSYVTGVSFATWGSPIRSFAGVEDALVAKISNGLRVDFNGDGQEDILWRYYGSGGHNRTWYLGNSEGAGSVLALGAIAAPISDMAGVLPGARVERKVPISQRGGTVALANRMKVTSPRSSRNPMEATGRQARSGMVEDPRRAGGAFAKPSGISITDPRLVNLGYDMPTSSDIKLASTPSVLGGGDVMPVGDLTWQIVGTGDFNNDTHVDILWRNTSSGSNVVWYMDGVNWTGSAALITVPDQSWKIVGTGDFNNDTYADILWRNTSTGSNVVWYMNGANWTGSAELLGVGDPTWQIVGTGDFNKDGKIDILWRYAGAGGYDVVWYMNGVNWSSSAELIHVGDLTWQIVGTGDYNNDGNVDILWRYNGAGGYNVIWYMNGVNWTASAELIPVPDLNWKIVSR